MPQEDLYTRLREQVPMEYPELQKYYGALTGGQEARQQVGQMTQRAGYEAGYNREVAEARRQAQIRSLREKKEALSQLDYKRVPKDVGYDFFDQLGKPITAYEYSRQKGISLFDALQGSNNVEDMEIVNDYKGLQRYIFAVMTPEDRRSEDENALIDFVDQKYPQLKGKTPQQTINAFMDRYKHVFR